MTDVIELDSDDDHGGLDGNAAGASIDIVNSVPLDLSAIFGSAGAVGGPIRSRPNGHSNNYQQHSRPTLTPYHRPVTATVRLPPPPQRSHNGFGHAPQRYGLPSGLNPSIRSSTAVTHTTSYQPLPRLTPSLPHHHSQQVHSLHGMQNGSMRNGGGLGQGREVMKVRLQMAQNGSYQRVPPREIAVKPVAPPPPPPVAEVSDERLKTYVFDAERAGSGIRGLPDGVMNSQRFRCTYGSCTSLIYGNVNFMNHLWSHVAVWKETDEEVFEKGKTDVDQLSTCPQCLARFDTPFQMQIHYTRAHSRTRQAVVINTCMICEKELKEICLKKHLTIHHERDAPYRCPCCSYKSNVRMHLYDHFARRHAHTTTLMCPFCTFFKNVELPQAKHKKRFTIIKSREFVSHMRKHESVADKRDIPRTTQEGVAIQLMFNPDEAATSRRRISCDKCAMCFTKQEDRIMHLKTMHVPLKENYVVRQRNTDTRARRQGELSLMAVGDHAMCKECKNKAPAERKKKCPTCARVQFSLDAVAAKNIGYSDGVPRASVVALARASVINGRCACSFESKSGNLLAAHFCTCRRQMRVMLKDKETKVKKEEEREQTSEQEKEEKVEMELFAIEPECAPVDEDEVKEKSAELEKEIQKAVVNTIKTREAAENAPVVVKKQPKVYVPINDPDAIDQMEERLRSLLFTPEAMTFRERISRNNFAESEKEFKQLMARREEE